MKRNKYHIGCLGISGENKNYKTIKFLTGIEIDGDKIPKFDFEKEPLEFSSEDADNLMRELLDQGWLAVTVRVPKDRKYICFN